MLASDVALFGVSKRLEHCGVLPVGELVARRSASGSGYIANLATCGLVHECPWCHAKIHAGRAVEVGQAVAAVQAMGGAATLITLTLPHDPADSLRLLLRGLDAGWSKITEGGEWTRLCKSIGFLGFYRAEEVTCSAVGCAGAGWHPHWHVLLFHAAPLEAEQLAALYGHFPRKWRHGVTSVGLRAPLSGVGCRIDPNVDEAATGAYVAKVQEGGWSAALELARGDVKDGRGDDRLVPFELVERFTETGDGEFARRFREYVRAMKGRSAIRSSRKLRERLGLAAAKSDAELAAAAADHVEDVAVIPHAVWRRVLAAQVEGKVYLAIGIGFTELNKVLAEHGCGWALLPSAVAKGRARGG